MNTTPIRSFRVPDELWAAAREQAAQQHTTVTAVILAALRAFIAQNTNTTGGTK